MNTLQNSDWFVRAVENWPMTLAFSFLLLAFFLWFLTPFAVFGVKRRLDRLADMMEQMISLLEKDSVHQSDSVKKDPEGEKG